MHGKMVRKGGVAGINGMAAAFIDVSFVMVLVMIFAVAALKTGAPERVLIDAELPGQAGAGEEAPATTLWVHGGGVAVNDGDITPIAGIAPLLEGIAAQGAVGLCVAEGVTYAEVRNAIAHVQAAMGPRQFVDCGGEWHD